MEIASPIPTAILNFNDPRGLYACPANYQVDATNNGITYRTTNIHLCYDTIAGYIVLQDSYYGWQIADVVKRRSWTQVEAAQHCGVTQPRMNDLLRGRVSRFDALVNISTALGCRVRVDLDTRGLHSVP